MVRYHRRSFIERLGLGAGTLLLSPICQTLLSEARGAATVGRKRAVFFVCGNGLPSKSLAPAEIPTGTQLDGATQFTWPEMLKNLERYRSRTLIIDGLANQVARESLHSCGYGALSCMTAANNGKNQYDGAPGGITIDQFLAAELSAGKPLKSVLFGAQRDTDGVTSKVFASGAERPESHILNPTLLYKTVFGELANVGPVATSGPSKGQIKHRLLLDALQNDVRKLRSAFAAPEQRRLDTYLAALEEFDKRQKAIGALTCAPGAPPNVTVATRTADVSITAMTEIAIVALTCGLTNVVGVSMGCGFSHGTFPGYGPLVAKGTVYESLGHVSGYIHDAKAEISMPIIHSYNFGLLARMADALSSVKEGDGTAFDDTVMVYTSDNGASHHQNHEEWPVVVLGTAGGKLKTNGRYLRYPRKSKTTNGTVRSLADFYCAIAHACGVPTDTFGKGGAEPVKGPLPEVLAS